MVMCPQDQRIYPTFEEWAEGQNELAFDTDDNLIRYIREMDEFRFVVESELKVPHTYMIDKKAAQDLFEEFCGSDLMVKWCRNYIQHPINHDSYRQWLIMTPMKEKWAKELEVGLYAS